MRREITAQSFQENQTIFIYKKGKGEFLRSLGFNQKLAEEIYEIKFDNRLQKVRSSHCFEIGPLKTFRSWSLGQVTIEIHPDPLRFIYLGEMVSVQEGEKWYQVKRFFNGNQLPLDWDDQDCLIAQRLDNWFTRLQAEPTRSEPVPEPPEAPAPKQAEKSALPEAKNQEVVKIYQSSEQASSKGFVELLQDLKDPKPIVRIQAIKQLGKMGSKEATPPLTKLLEDANPKVRAAVAEAFMELKDPRTYQFLIHLLKDYEADVRFYAVTALGELEIQKALAPIKVLLNKEQDKRVKSRALETFNKLT